MKSTQDRVPCVAQQARQMAKHCDVACYLSATQNAAIAIAHATEKEGAPMERAIELAGFFAAHGIWSYKQ